MVSAPLPPLRPITAGLLDVQVPLDTTICPACPIVLPISGPPLISSAPPVSQTGPLATFRGMGLLANELSIVTEPPEIVNVPKVVNEEPSCTGPLSHRPSVMVNDPEPLWPRVVCAPTGRQKRKLHAKSSVTNVPVFKKRALSINRLFCTNRLEFVMFTVPLAEIVSESSTNSVTEPALLRNKLL